MTENRGIISRLVLKAKLWRAIKEAEIEAQYRLETIERKYNTTSVPEMEKPLTAARKLFLELKNDFNVIKRINIIVDKESYTKLMECSRQINEKLENIKKEENNIVEIHNEISKTVRECARMCKLIDQKLPKLAELILKYNKFSIIENKYKQFEKEHREIPTGEEIDPFEALVRIYNQREKIGDLFEKVNNLLYETYETANNFQKIEKLKETIIRDGIIIDKETLAKEEKMLSVGDIQILRRNSEEVITILEKEIEMNRS